MSGGPASREATRMADEQPPNLVQLTTEYLKTRLSDRLRFSINAGFWHLNIDKTVRKLSTSFVNN
ncbi:hypothetical protein EFM55_15135 [Lactiplantibacillus pentosus]|nr:hypothetical protein [Lactiplantibacillus pentosus]